MAWTYDLETRRYRDEDTGREFGERQLRPLRERFLRQVTDRSLVVTGQLANRELTLEEWEVEMRRVVKDAFGTMYMLSRGGRNVMTQSDWGRVGALVGRQYRYLNEYARAIDGETVTRERALSRSTLYVQAATQGYQRGQLAGFADMPRLERVPGDGSTTCLVNCLPGDQLVRADRVRGGYRRWYDGELLTLTTKGGHRLSVTSNHPVLTHRGWVAAQELHTGDQLVCDSFAKRMAVGQPHVDDAPTPIAEIVRSLDQHGSTKRVVGVAVDFHGDGRDGQIDVVRANGQLGRHQHAARLKPLLELPLGRFGEHLPAGRSGSRLATEFFFRPSHATHGVMRSFRPSASLLRCHDGHAHAVGLTCVAALNASTHESRANRVAIDAESARKRQFAFAGEISLGDVMPGKIDTQPSAGSSGWLADLFDQAFAERAEAAPQLARDLRERLATSDAFDELLVIDRQAFHGYVYNLETESGLYGAASLAVRNCRCELDVSETEDGWEVYWLDLGDERECTDCRQLAVQWAPLQLQRQAAQEGATP